jgi:diguanylate cyclase (GGDEF)-like protein
VTAPAASSERSRRGRLLVVADAMPADRDFGLLEPRIEHAENLYDAVGRVTRAGAAAPIEAIVIHRNQITRSATAVVQSIRRLDPTVLLYLVIDDDSADDTSDDDAVSAGFDGLLHAPVSPYVLGAILGEELPPPVETRLSHEDGPIRPSHPVAEDAEEASNAEGDPALNRTAAACTPLRCVDDSAVPVATPAFGEMVLPTAPGRTLGDIDLVDQSLDDPARLPALALAMIAQETGWMDIRLAPESAAHGLGAPVRHGPRGYGRLIAPTASPDAIAPWAGWLGRWMRLAESQLELRALSYTDPLTGAWNRRFFDEFLPIAIERARGKRRQLALMLFDVDELKRFNDQFGHATGDLMLRETVRLLVSIVRKGDRVCRVGGDEFVAVFADEEPPRKAGSSPIDSIEAIAQRFRDEICRMKFPILGAEAPGSLSISAGVAIYPWDGHDGPTLLRAADALAMESKRRGKNAITIGRAAIEACRQSR